VTKERDAELLSGISNPFAALSLLYSYEHNSGRNGHDVTQRELDNDHDDEDEDSIPDLVEIDASRVPTPDERISTEARMAIDNIPYALPQKISAAAQD
jgi:hypothetical protein